MGSVPSTRNNDVSVPTNPNCFQMGSKDLGTRQDSVWASSYGWAFSSLSLWLLPFITPSFLIILIYNILPCCLNFLMKFLQDKIVDITSSTLGCWLGPPQGPLTLISFYSHISAPCLIDYFQRFLWGCGGGWGQLHRPPQPTSWNSPPATQPIPAQILKTDPPQPNSVLTQQETENKHSVPFPSDALWVWNKGQKPRNLRWAKRLQKAVCRW